MSRRKTYFNWSTGKDSALALHQLQQDGDYDVEFLLTSVNAHHRRVTMHGLRIELFEKQLKEIGLNSGVVELPEMPSNEIYEALLATKVKALKEQGFDYAGFGDIFLEDLKTYREKQLASLGVTPVFPLWKKDTRELMHDFIEKGFKAITVCINGGLLDKSFLGRVVDQDFINALPGNVDPCGENGEFHTFCYEGPIFKNPIDFTIGERVERSYAGTPSTPFLFCDLLPVE